MTGCTWCGHAPHVGACASRIAVRRHPGRPAAPIDQTIDCPCARRAI